MPDRTRARKLAAEFNQKGDPTGWFEHLYQEAEVGKSTVPWADLCPNLHLLDFWKAHPRETAGKLALIIGSGLGDDAEQLAAWGFQATAFDISESAIRATRKRFPNSAVDYLTADLLNPPSAFLRKFDFVLEVYTLQVLPVALRPSAIKALTGFLRPGGLLLVVARGREPSDPKGQMPWPLMRSELANFVAAGLHQISFEDYPDPQDTAVRRFRALYSRPL